MKKHPHPRSPFTALLPLAVLCHLLLGSCGDQPPPVKEPVRDHEAAFTLPADSMHVYDSTYLRVSAVFEDNFGLGAGRAIPARQQELAWNEFASKVPNDGEPYHGVMLDYGLMHDSLLFGVSIFPMRPTEVDSIFEYADPDSLYQLTAGELHPRLATRWRTDFQYDTANPSVYFSKVRAIRNGAWEPLNAVSDAHAGIVAWENELLVLYDENASGHGDSTLHVVITSIAEPNERGILQHRACYHLRVRPNGFPNGAYRDLLNNSRDPKALLRMHGADFGNLRPPHQSTYIQPPR